MKKIGIILAALVITMFFVGAVAAMPANNPPDQREKFREDCCVQGVGAIWYEKSVLDKEIAVDVYELMFGDTGGNGSFAMTIHEVLNEGVRLNCTASCSDQGMISDPIYGDAHSPVMVNFECNKMIQFDSYPLNKSLGLGGFATYSSPGFHGGLNAQVTETYDVWKLQKDETVKMTTTATFDGKDRIWDGCGKVAKPYTANELSYDSKNDFGGEWGTDSTWKKVCSKDIEHTQRFWGEFQVDKYLMFKEEVTAECPEKEPKGDC